MAAQEVEKDSRSQQEVHAYNVVAWAEYLRTSIEERSWKEVHNALLAIKDGFEHQTAIGIINSMRQQDPRSPLHIAIERNAPPAITSLLIECGADLSLQAQLVAKGKITIPYKLLGNAISSTAHIALAFGRLDIYEQIIERAPDTIEDGTFGKNTPLHYLAAIHVAEDKEDNVISLLKKSLTLKLNPLRKNYSSQSPLTYALQGGHIQRAAVLLNALPPDRLVECVATVAESIEDLLTKKEWTKFSQLISILRSLSPSFGEKIANAHVQVDQITYPLIAQCIALEAPVGMVKDLLALGAIADNNVTHWRKNDVDGNYSRFSFPIPHFVVLIGKAHHLEELSEQPQLLEYRDTQGNYPVSMLVTEAIPTELEEKIVIFKNKAPQQLTVRDRVGHNLLDQAFLNGTWDAAILLHRQGIRLGVFDDGGLAQIATQATHHIRQCCAEKKWKKLVDFLSFLLSTIEEDNPNFIESLLSHENRNKLTLAYELVLSGASIDVIELAHHCGAQFNAPTRYYLSITTAPISLNIDQTLQHEFIHNSFSLRATREDLRSAVVSPLFLGALESGEKNDTYVLSGVTPLHLAYASGSVETIHAMERFSHIAIPLDQQGNPPYFYAFLNRNNDRIAVLSYAAQTYRELLGQRNSFGVSAYSLAIAHAGMKDVRATFGDTLAQTYGLSHLSALEEQIEACSKIGVFSINNLISMIIRGLPLDIARDITAFIYDEPSNDQTKDKPALALPYFFNGLNRDLLIPLCRRIEYSGKKGYYHGETELLALINHPSDPSAQDTYASAVTLGLTASRRWLYDTPLEDPTSSQRSLEGLQVWNWTRTGTLAHSATRLLFDCWSLKDPEMPIMVLSPSLIESFGAKRIIEPTPSIHGAGFIYQELHKLNFLNKNGKRVSLPDGTVIILRRGYFLISHPEVGTYVVGNKSPIFGRDKLQEPGYFSLGTVHGAFSLQQLSNLTTESIERHFSSIMDPKINYQDTHQRIDILLTCMFGFLRAYECWKFNTDPDTAFLTIDGLNPQLANGGHLSAGFSYVVNYLNDLYFLSLKYPDTFHLPKLAFMHPRHTPHVRFAYTQPDGNKSTSLTITPDILEIFRNMIDGTDKEIAFKTSDLKRTGLGSFFQDAGFSTMGSLIFIKE